MFPLKFSFHGIVSIEVQALVVVPANPDDFVITVTVQVKTPGPQVHLMSCPHQLGCKTGIPIVEIDLGLMFSSLVFVGDQVHVSVMVNVHLIQVVHGPLCNHHPVFPIIGDRTVPGKEYPDVGVGFMSRVALFGYCNIQFSIAIEIGDFHPVDDLHFFTYKVFGPELLNITRILCPVEQFGFLTGHPGIPKSQVEVPVTIQVPDPDSFIGIGCCDPFEIPCFF